MIGSIILAALLSALFWAVITGRLRLPEGKPDVWERNQVVIVGERATMFPDLAVFEPQSFVSTAWRIVPAPPFDWSQHADL